jgi:hypothetical protein
LELTEPSELVAQLHTRMPVILTEEHHETWLSNQVGKEVLVRSHKRIKPCFSLEKQIPVTELGPSHLEGCCEGVARQMSPQWPWCSLIAHLASTITVISTHETMAAACKSPKNVCAHAHWRVSGIRARFPFRSSGISGRDFLCVNVLTIALQPTVNLRQGAGSVRRL